MYLLNPDCDFDYSQSNVHYNLLYKLRQYIHVRRDNFFKTLHSILIYGHFSHNQGASVGA